MGRPEPGGKLWPKPTWSMQAVKPRPRTFNSAASRRYSQRNPSIASVAPAGCGALATTAWAANEPAAEFRCPLHPCLSVTSAASSSSRFVPCKPKIAGSAGLHRRWPSSAALAKVRSP